MYTAKGSSHHELGLARHGLFALMLTAYMIHEGYQFGKIKYSKRLHFLRSLIVYMSRWENVLDTVLIGSSLAYLVTLAYNHLILRNIVAFYYKNLFGSHSIWSESFSSLHYAIRFERALQVETSVMLFTGFLKALDLLELNPKTYLIADTLRAGSSDLTVFLLFVLANYALFGVCGHVMFASTGDEQFATLTRSIYTSVLSIVQNIDFDLLIHKKLIWLVVWQTLLYFYAQRVLINFVVAVIIHYFEQVAHSFLF